MEKKHYVVGYYYLYTGLSTVSYLVFGTEDQAKQYCLDQLDTKPKWLKNQVNRNFNNKESLTYVFCKEQEIIIL